MGAVIESIAAGLIGGLLVGPALSLIIFAVFRPLFIRRK